MDEIFAQGHAWIDGNFVALAEAKISILDWGFLRSDATDYPTTGSSSTLELRVVLPLARWG